MALDCITYRLSFNNFQWDMPSITVMEVTRLVQLDLWYEDKLSLVKLFHNSLITLISYASCVERLRLTSEDKISPLLRDFLHIFRKTHCYKGAVLWDFVSDHFSDSCNFRQFSKKVKLDSRLKELNFKSLSVQSVLRRYLILPFNLNF